MRLRPARLVPSPPALAGLPRALASLVLLALAGGCRENPFAPATRQVDLADLPSLSVVASRDGGGLAVKLVFPQPAQDACLGLRAAAATLNGAPLAVTSLGEGWRNPDGRIARCDLPSFALNGAWPAPGAPDELAISDATRTVRARFTDLVSPRSAVLSLPADGTLRAGDPATLTWSPASDVPAPVPPDAAIRISFSGGGASAAAAAGAPLVTANQILFTVAPLPVGPGELVLDPGRATLAVAGCEGAQECSGTASERVAIPVRVVP